MSSAFAELGVFDAVIGTALLIIGYLLQQRIREQERRAERLIDIVIGLVKDNAALEAKVAALQRSIDRLERD